MRYAKVENSKVVNVIVADVNYIATLEGEYVESDTANVGDTFTNGIFTKTTPKQPVPESVAMWQARDFLIANNLLDNVLATIDAIPDPVAKKRAQSKFEFSSTVRRDDPLLNYVCTSAGFSSEDVDQWFIEANSI
jgi:hypothetical protein